MTTFRLETNSMTFFYIYFFLLIIIIIIISFWKKTFNAQHLWLQSYNIWRLCLFNCTTYHVYNYTKKCIHYATHKIIFLFVSFYFIFSHTSNIQFNTIYWSYIESACLLFLSSPTKHLMHLLHPGITRFLMNISTGLLFPFSQRIYRIPASF